MASNQHPADTKENRLQKFYDYFNAQMRELNRELDDAIKEAIATAIDRTELDRLTKETQRVQQEVQDASDFTPDHDVAKYAQTLKDFKDRLQTARNLNAPKSKFAFKSARKVAPAVAAKEASTSPSGRPTIPFPTLDDGGNDDDAVGEEYDDLSYKHLITDPSHKGVLSHITHTVIDLRRPSMSYLARHATLAVKKVRGSLLILGRVEGALHVTDVRNSVIVVEAGQVRLHECQDVSVYLTCASRPIIEDSKDVRFAPLPYTYIGRTAKISASLPAESRPEPIKENKWDQVDDFNWLKQGKSPNWRVLDEEDRIPESTWSDMVPGSDKIGLTDILNSVGIKGAERRRSRRGSETAGGDGF